MSLALAKQFAAAMTAAGLRTVTNPRNVVTPCVVLAPPVRDYDLSCGGYTATWRAYLLAGGSGAEETWYQLDEMCEQLSELLDIETVTPTAWRSESTADGATYPAYLATFTSAVTED